MSPYCSGVQVVLGLHLWKSFYCLICGGDLRGSALLLLSGLTSLLQDLEINTSVGSSQITQVVLEPQACVRAAHSWEFIFLPLIHTYRVHLPSLMAGFFS